MQKGRHWVLVVRTSCPLEIPKENKTSLGVTTGQCGTRVEY